MKSSEQQVTVTINVCPNEAWEIISSINNVDKWFPEMIKSCKVEGNTRICGTEQGDIIEEVLKIDHENKEFKYAIIEQNLIPNIHNVIGNAKVMSDDGKTVINWRWTFNVDNAESENQAKEIFADAGSMSLKALENYILKQR